MKLNNERVSKLAHKVVKPYTEAIQRKKKHWKRSFFPSAYFDLEIRSRGAVGESIASQILTDYGFIVAHSKESDRVVNGFGIEIKFATESALNGDFTFNQLRSRKCDEFVLCVGMGSHAPYLWLFRNNSQLRESVDYQHDGKKTWIFKIDPNNPQQWVKDLELPLEVLRRH